ncbi:MAG: divalent metal cation transporter [Candidatus Palauibacterales bacterium]|nr:divalent metal cation transporter [Candidatus Palauibacterales bacterium]
MGSGISISGFRKAFGPGLMWAAAAIGVSHLVQSTRAGAMAGFGLAGIVLLALVLKYPFFEFGPRYAAATGLSLVEGYRRIGRWALWLYLLITLSTALIVQVAIVLFTAFLLKLVLHLGLSVSVVAALLCGLCASLLAAGRFSFLDRVIKLVMVLLAASTLAAAAITLPRADFSTIAFWPRDGARQALPLAFVLALVGWMPSAIDISVWSSLWTLAKDRATGQRADPASVLLDFRIGYVATGLMAFAFLTLGATIMFGAGQEFGSSGTQFSAQLVDLYTRTLGGWTRPIVYTAVVTTMFSTTLTVIDGFPRAIDRGLRVAFVEPEGTSAYAGTGRAYWGAMGILSALTVLVLAVFPGSLTAMVDFATIVSFITAPALGYLNLRAVTSPAVSTELRPGRVLVALSWLGLAVLGSFAVVYAVSRLG